MLAHNRYESGDEKAAGGLAGLKGKGLLKKAST